MAYQPVELDFDLVSPGLNELTARPNNPFLDYRLTVRLTPPNGAPAYEVPGYFISAAGDGDPCDGVVPDGGVWQVRFTPENIPGPWGVHVIFEHGVGSDSRPINVSDDVVPSPNLTPLVDVDVDDIFVGNYDSTAPGFYGKGILRFDPLGDASYMAFSNPTLPASERYFVMTGMGSPENFLAYREFYKSDKNPTSLGVLHTYETLAPTLPGGADPPSHLDDFQAGDPGWATTYYKRTGGGQYTMQAVSDSSGCTGAEMHPAGRGILGALRYLESQGVNSIYLMPMNLGGDGRDVHPFAEVPIADIGGDCPSDHDAALHYSVKRMREWSTVLDFAMQRGIMVNMVLWEQEIENLGWLSYGPDMSYACSSPPQTYGELTWARRLYLKQMAAYFGHLNGLKWTLCEEATDPCIFEMPLCSAPPGNNDRTFTRGEIEDIVAWLKRWDGVNDHPVTLHTDGNSYHIYETVLTNGTGATPAPWLTATSLQMSAGEDQTLNSPGWEAGLSDSVYHNYGATVEKVREQFAQFGGAGRQVVVDVDELGNWIRGASGSNDFPNRADTATYASFLASPAGKRRTAIYDILFSGGNVSWYTGWHTASSQGTTFVGNEAYGGGDLWVDEFRSREVLFEYSLAARTRLRSLPFWLAGANDARITGEYNDSDPAESYGGAEVFEHYDLASPPNEHFILAYYPEAYRPGSGFNFGAVAMPGIGVSKKFVSFFVDPRDNSVIADSRVYFDGSYLSGGAYIPAASATMSAAAANGLHDFILQVQRITP